MGNQGPHNDAALFALPTSEKATLRPVREPGSAKIGVRGPAMVLVNYSGVIL
jgi:hypothetical protein